MDKSQMRIKKALLNAMKKQVYGVDAERRFVCTLTWMFDLEHFFDEEKRTSLYYELKAVANSTVEREVNALWRTCALEDQEACTETGLMTKALNDGKLVTCSIVQPVNSRYFLLPTDQIALAGVLTGDQYELQYTSERRPIEVWAGGKMVGLIMPVLQGDAGESSLGDRLKNIVEHL